jgi:hypothetical protein
VAHDVTLRFALAFFIARDALRLDYSSARKTQSDVSVC